MAVTLTKHFAADFASDAQKDKFVESFKAWKKAADPCSTHRFGKNVTTAVPIGHDFDHLWHVHLVPEDEDARERWWFKYTSKTTHVRCNRESDSLLFYVEYKGDFLLIRKTDHGLMRPPKEKLDAVCAIADRWVSSKKAASKSSSNP